MKTRLFMALSALSLFLGASSACAELVRVTYAGIVGYGYDETGLFGSPETDLESESYQATFVFDDYRGFYYRAGYGYTDLLSSGPSLDGGIPFVTATTTINGHSVTVEGCWGVDVER